jgi:hypothetical protein
MTELKCTFGSSYIYTCNDEKYIDQIRSLEIFDEPLLLN